jgi:hypothetical protein
MATINRRKHAQNAKEFLFIIIFIHVQENKNRLAKSAIFFKCDDLKKKGKHKMPKNHVIFDSDRVQWLYICLCFFLGKSPQMSRICAKIDRQEQEQERTRALLRELEMNKSSTKLRR